MIEILGAIGLAGIGGFHISQLFAAWRAKRLKGFSLLGWSCCAAGCVALAIQMALLHIWTTFSLQVLVLVVDLEILRQVLRKQVK